MKRNNLLLLGAGFFFGVGTIIACSDDDPAATQQPSTEDSGTPQADSATHVPRPDAEVLPDDLQIKTYSSDANGLYVNSYVVYGNTNAMLIDGQFFKADAQKVVELIQSTGKNLKYVVLTHAHPDHFLGFETIKAAFPNAQFVSAGNVAGMYAAAAQPMLDGLKTQFGAAIADTIVPVTPLPIAMRVDLAPQSEIELDGNGVKLYLQKFPGDVATMVVVALPDKSVFAGDLVLNKVHLNLSECTGEGWNRDLGMLAPFLYNKYYPGHGPGPVNFMTAIPEMNKYIDVATSIIRDQAGFAQLDASAPSGDGVDAGGSADDVEIAKARIRAAFPDYQGEAMLDMSVRGYMNGSPATMGVNCEVPPDAGPP